MYQPCKQLLIIMVRDVHKNALLCSIETHIQAKEQIPPTPSPRLSCGKLWDAMHCNYFFWSGGANKINAIAKLDKIYAEFHKIVWCSTSGNVRGRQIFLDYIKRQILKVIWACIRSQCGSRKEGSRDHEELSFLWAFQHNEAVVRGWRAAAGGHRGLSCNSQF